MVSRGRYDDMSSWSGGRGVLPVYLPHNIFQLTLLSSCIYRSVSHLLRIQRETWTITSIVQFILCTLQLFKYFCHSYSIIFGYNPLKEYLYFGRFLPRTLQMHLSGLVTLGVFLACLFIMNKGITFYSSMQMAWMLSQIWYGDLSLSLILTAASIICFG